MKKNIILYFVLFSCLNLYSQNWNPKYVSHWTYLHKKADVSSEKIGILATEASVKLLDSTEFYYKIKVSNGDVGFILQQSLTKTMRGNKDEDEPAEYFYRGIEGHQCPHLFVQVSGLRSRKEPNTKSAISELLQINKQECVDYLPISKEGWVYIGDHFHKNPAFVQYKFLGKEISFEEILRELENTKASDKDQQKILLERLVEIGWNSTPNNSLKALQLFKAFHQKKGTLAALPDIDFELFLVEQIQNQLTSEERENFNYKGILVLINGQEFKDGEITESKIKGLNFLKTSDLRSLPNFSECGWEPVFAYVNKSKNTVINFENTYNKVRGLVESLSLVEGNAIIIDGFRIDENTSEEDFIKKCGKIINFDRFNSPGTYYLPYGDAGTMIINFKNRKAISYQLSFYC